MILYCDLPLSHQRCPRGFHWCRSSLEYLAPTDSAEDTSSIMPTSFKVLAPTKPTRKRTAQSYTPFGYMFFRTGNSHVPVSLGTVETGLGPCHQGLPRSILNKELGRLILSRGYDAHWLICISLSPAAGIGHKSLVSEPHCVQQTLR